MSDIQRRIHHAESASMSWTRRGSPQFFLCPSRRCILRELWFGLSIGETGILIGDSGLGKTELCRELLTRLPTAVHSVYMTAPRIGGHRRLLDNISHSLSIMASIAKQRHRSSPNSADTSIRALPTRWAIVIDDAQHISEATGRLLAAWRRHEAEEGRSVGLLLVGARSLKGALAQGALAEFRSQVTMHCELPMLSRNETRTYIDHWLKTCAEPQLRFSDSARRTIHYATRGIPEKINAVCERAVSSAHEGKRSLVSALMAARAAWSLSESSANHTSATF